MTDTPELGRATDERLPDELRDTVDHAGHPMSLEQWQQIDAYLNPPDPPPASRPPVSPERQYLLDCLANGHDQLWWPTHTPEEFAAMLHEGAESDDEHWFADHHLTVHTTTPEPPADVEQPEQQSVPGRPADEVEAEDEAAGRNAAAGPDTVHVPGWSPPAPEPAQ